MKKKTYSKLQKGAISLSAIWLFVYFLFGSIIFKNMWNTSPALPLIGGVVALLPLVFEILNLLYFNSRRVDIAIICICPLLCIAHFLFFAFVVSKLIYFFVAGAPYLITAAIALILAFFVFAFPRLPKLWKRITAISLSAVFAVVCLTCLFNFTPFYIDGGATVFITDDGYQIAFSSSHPSTGAVEVNGKTYYDSTNGENNVSKLHKLSVPKDELDLARAYTIRTRSVAFNTAYLPSKGRIIEKSFSFRPVDGSDGIKIYNLSDTHECFTGPANAASYFGEELDLLILNGDIINEVSTQYQISLIYKLAHKVTGGEIPVIFVRGNHECNGKLASRLNEFVGCSKRGFYFNAKFGSALSLLVLDTVNDMKDGNPFISPIANFDTVRSQESEWLKNNDWNDCTYNIILSHIPYPLSGYQSEKKSWSGWARELASLTAGKAQLALCGHSHKTHFAEEGTPDNEVVGFPVARGAIRSNKYPDRAGVSPFEFTGTAIELKDNKISIKFTNARHSILFEKVLEV